MKLSRTFIGLILFSFGVGVLQAQTPTTSSKPQDCGAFVQQFYNWYVAKVNALMKRNSRESALEDARREAILSVPRVGEGLRRGSSGLQKIAWRDRRVGFRPISQCPRYC